MHAFIILTKVILGMFWAISETDTWELLQTLVELTRNDPNELDSGVSLDCGLPTIRVSVRVVVRVRVSVKVRVNTTQNPNPQP